MTPKRIGILGAGPMGRLHARTVARSAAEDGRCVLTAVVDRHRGRARALAEEFGANATSELEDVVEDVDAFIICVPTSAHFQFAELLLERDRDLLVEKPLTLTLEEGRRIAALAAARGRILQVGHVEWYNPGWRKAVDEAGTPRLIEVDRVNPSSDRSLDLDVVQDLMLHDLDWVTRLLADDIVELAAQGRCVVHERLDEAEAQLRFESGCRVHLRVSRVHQERRRQVRIEGSKGVVAADLLTGQLDGSNSESGQSADPLANQWRDFMESLRSRKNPETDASVGVAALEVVDRVRRAIDEGSGSQLCDDDSALGR
jgi:predicted dehydrogenase